MYFILLPDDPYIYFIFKVQWECREKNSQYQAYPAEINTKLETAHQRGELKVDWLEEEDGNARHWTIDLAKMIETDGKLTKEVKRRVIAEGEIELTNQVVYIAEISRDGLHEQAREFIILNLSNAPFKNTSVCLKELLKLVLRTQVILILKNVCYNTDLCKNPFVPKSTIVGFFEKH